MLQNRVATLKSINIAQVIDIHIFTKVKSVIKEKYKKCFSNRKKDISLQRIKI